MHEPLQTPISQMGHFKLPSDEKGLCFAETLNIISLPKSTKSSSSMKIFSAPKFIASFVPTTKKLTDLNMYSPKKASHSELTGRKPNKAIEVIEENPYAFGQIIERDSISDVDVEQDQMVFIDVQNAHTHNIFRQRMQTPNYYSEYNFGPRFTNDGKVVRRSILGNPDTFTKMQNILFKNSNEPGTRTGERKTSILRGSTIKDKSNTINKSLTSINSTSSIDEGGEKKKKVAHSTISSKKPDMEPGKFHERIRIGKDELIQDIEKAEQRQITNNANDNMLLENLPLQDKRFFTKEQRILEKFNQTQDMWERKTRAVAGKVKRKIESCIMAKTDEYRLKLETAQTLDLLKNDDEKYGNQYWYLTLRDYPTNLRPETNTIFKKSRMNFNKNNLEIVRKNNEKPNQTPSPKKIFTVYGQNEYLEEKLKKNKHKLNVILPTDDDNFISMQVF